MNSKRKSLKTFLSQLRPRIWPLEAYMGFSVVSGEGSFTEAKTSIYSGYTCGGLLHN